MEKDFSMQEKIELIINLYTFPKGYLAECINDFPEAKKFINAGYADLNTENNTYYANQQGFDFLHIAIKQISEDLISFAKRNGRTISQDDLVLWVETTYGLTDACLKEEITKYILDNLPNYNYQIYFSRRRNKYILDNI